MACSDQILASLDYEEVNALRYTAGYVIRALRKKIDRSAHPLMEELILCLVEMEENEGTEHESEACNQQRRVETRQQHDLHVVCIDGTST